MTAAHLDSLIPKSLLQFFTLRGWPEAAAAGKPVAKAMRVDVGAKMRGMWK